MTREGCMSAEPSIPCTDNVIDSCIYHSRIHRPIPLIQSLNSYQPQNASIRTNPMLYSFPYICPIAQESSLYTVCSISCWSIKSINDGPKLYRCVGIFHSFFFLPKTRLNEDQPKAVITPTACPRKVEITQDMGHTCQTETEQIRNLRLPWQ